MDERGIESLRLFAEGIEMGGMPFLLSLRTFLQKFKLPGEAQMVDRILEAFSKAYCKANPNDFSSTIIVHSIGESMDLYERAMCVLFWHSSNNTYTQPSLSSF